MGFRFRKIIRVLPGVSLNLSKTGVSTSLGKRGVMVNVGRGRKRVTVGLPGTGLSYSKDFKDGFSRDKTALLFFVLLIAAGIIVYLWMHQA